MWFYYIKLNCCIIGILNVWNIWACHYRNTTLLSSFFENLETLTVQIYKIIPALSVFPPNFSWQLCPLENFSRTKVILKQQWKTLHPEIKVLLCNSLWLHSLILHTLNWLLINHLIFCIDCLNPSDPSISWLKWTLDWKWMI